MNKTIPLLLIAAACGGSSTTMPNSTPVTPAASVTTAAQPPEDDATRVRAFIDKLVAKDWDGVVASFDDTMRGALPKDKLVALWDSLMQNAGALQGIDSVDVQPKGDASLVTVKARFAKAPLVLRIGLDAQKRVAGFFVAPGDTAAATWQAPPYAKEDAFEEKPIKVLGSPGIWTTPKTGKPFPAVVLVHGSGPNDADETIGGMKVFKDLAWGLATRGIAVLRYDKKLTSVRTQKEEVEDAAHAAIAMVATLPDVDGKRVVLIGHSQGGYLAPRIAKADSSIKGIVMLAGSTRPLEDSMLAQLHYLAGMKPDDATLKELLASAEQFKKDVESPTLKPDDVVKIPGASPIGGAYFLDVRGYHPEQVAAQLAIPMLVLQGERDYQVTVKEDFPAWKHALGTRKNATLKTYPALNHLLSAGTGPSTPDEYKKPGHVDEAVVTDIADWVNHLR